MENNYSHKLVLYNDDKHDFLYVIACLIRCCKHDPIQAEQCAVITHREEGVVYTVETVINMGLQPGKLGVTLKEVQLSKKSFPYEYYDATRFIPIEGLVTEVEKEVVKEVELDIV